MSKGMAESKSPGRNWYTMLCQTKVRPLSEYAAEIWCAIQNNYNKSGVLSKIIIRS